VRSSSLPGDAKMSIVALIAEIFSVLGTRLGKRIVAGDDDKSLVQNSHHISFHDALRVAFTTCLHVPFHELNKDSSFMAMGGNSVVAIQFSHILKEHCYSTTIVQTLELDTIERF
jgi:hypothetical protein